MPASACADAYADVPEATLFPTEAAAIAHAITERRREFATVRWCARRALARLGLPPAAILPDAEGVPQWPAGVVGSMTHCAGYRAALVARSDRLRAIGIDAEPHAALPEPLDELVLSTRERWQVRELGEAHPDIHWDCVVFCAKEAVFKACYPSTRRWLDFTDIAVSVHPAGTFEARAGGDHGLAGHWLVDRGLVVAATAVAA